ncbi:MAG: hypothetical protein SFY80_10675 [Verrucomicrobiota bacterium]|nr:hypothetical protein [Verrucomicrobiota bacterium]
MKYIKYTIKFIICVVGVFIMLVPVWDIKSNFWMYIMVGGAIFLFGIYCYISTLNRIVYLSPIKKPPCKPTAQTTAMTDETPLKNSLE